MEKLASRHAIAELMSWISLMENIIGEDQNKIMGAVGSEVVQNFLQKYKVERNTFIQFFFFLPDSVILISLMMPRLYLTGFSHRSDL